MEELHCTLSSVKGGIECIKTTVDTLDPGCVTSVPSKLFTLFSDQKDKNWKTNKASIGAIMWHPTALFVSPKQGGILQSSGFLDLKSLMALNLTCKAHALDELSLTLLIENEITRSHGVSSLEEAIDLLHDLFRIPCLKQWLNRTVDRTDASIMPTQDTMIEVVCYEVMLVKMLKTLPESQRLQIVRELDEYDKTLLHYAADAGNPESIHFMLSVLPKSEHIHVVSKQDTYGWSVLHYAAKSGNLQSIMAILAVYPEPQHEQLLTPEAWVGITPLHRVFGSKEVDTIEAILCMLTESQRTQAMNLQDRNGRTPLHYVASRDFESWHREPLYRILTLLPDVERLQIVTKQDRFGRTVLHHFHRDDVAAVEAILDLLPLNQASEETIDSIVEILVKRDMPELLTAKVESSGNKST